MEWYERKVLLDWSWSNKPNAMIMQPLSKVKSHAVLQGLGQTVCAHVSSLVILEYFVFKKDDHCMICATGNTYVPPIRITTYIDHAAHCTGELFLLQLAGLEHETRAARPYLNARGRSYLWPATELNQITQSGLNKETF